MVRPADSVERRIVVEYGRQYAYVYFTDGNGRVLDDESFKQPYRMERKEAHEEAKDCYDVLYDWMNDTINYPTAGLGEADDRPEV